MKYITLPPSGLNTTAAPMPMIGLGLWKIPKQIAAQQVVEAIKMGYRHFDSACDYGNEVEVGKGLHEAIDLQKLCKREDLFVTSKLWNTFHRKEHVRAALLKTLEDLGLEYLDLYLIHFPAISLKFVPFTSKYPPEWVSPDKGKMEMDWVPLSETWQEMEKLVHDGLVRHIGLCNINVQSLVDLISYAHIRPSVIQVELHPTLTQENLVKFVQQHNMVVTAFSPLGSGSYVELNMAKPESSVLENIVVTEIAKSKSKTPAQVVLRWGIQRNTVVIPKSNSLSRLRENISIFDFELSEDEMKSISGLNRNLRLNDPGVFCLPMGEFIPIYD